MIIVALCAFGLPCVAYGWHTGDGPLMIVGAVALLCALWQSEVGRYQQRHKPASFDLDRERLPW